MYHKLVQIQFHLGLMELLEILDNAEFLLSSNHFHYFLVYLRNPLNVRKRYQSNKRFVDSHVYESHHHEIQQFQVQWLYNRPKSLRHPLLPKMHLSHHFFCRKLFVDTLVRIQFYILSCNSTHHNRLHFHLDLQWELDNLKCSLYTRITSFRMRRLQLISQQKSGHHDHISSKLKNTVSFW